MTYDFSQITEVKLAEGAHASANDGLCFMEMAAWFAGEAHSDELQALRNETRFLPELEGDGFFPVGQRTSELSKSQFSGLLEIVFAWCAREGVQLSDETQRLAA